MKLVFLYPFFKNIRGEHIKTSSRKEERNIEYTVSKLEQETIITFNESEKTADIYTFNKKLKRKLMSLSEDRPDECIFTKDYSDGALNFTIPKKWVKVIASKILSDEQKQEITNRLK